MSATVYLIPAVLHDDEQALQTIPPYIVPAIKNCSVFFVENEKTARRFFKKLWKEMVIDEYEWHAIHKAETEVAQVFVRCLQQKKAIGIVSEAGCPGVADPGQHLISLAQEHKAIVKPLVGPSSLLLALMASGMNGQQFAFHGYLPIDSFERKKKIKELEEESRKKKSTQLFIETPYRNGALLADILHVCQPSTKLCIAAELTSTNETIQTQTIAVWKKSAMPSLHKIPVIFLLQAE